MKTRISIVFALLILFGYTGCTDLKEEVLDESLNGGTSDDQIADGSIAPVYAILPGLFLHTNYFTLQEISTDEAILPYRGGTDWGDNGIFIDMHRHTYTSSHVRIQNAWESVTQGISRAVTAINTLTPLADTDSKARTYLAEARGMRAYYSLLTLDLFGLVFVKDDPEEISVILRGNDAVEYIESELLAVEEQLDNSVGPGRLTPEAVQGLLARLYLNAAVYRDPYTASFNFTDEDMDKVITYTSRVINSGRFAFSPEYFDIFDDDNHFNQEIIFAVDQRADLNGHNRLAYFSLSGDMFPNPAFVNANGTDGPGITSDFYQTWVQAYGSTDPADADPRFFKENLIIPSDSCMAAGDFEPNRGILRGQQYGLLTSAKGQPFERCDGGGYRIGKLRNITRADQTQLVNHTEHIDFTGQGSGYSTGYRVLKYEFSKQSEDGRGRGEADIIILRLADMYMMRAEAMLRKSASDAAAALSDVNTVRTSRTARTTPPALNTMSLDILYRERGFEFYWEMLRRTDMIRFGKYEDNWTEKTDSNVHKRLFPIPQTAIDGASNSPGYLVQNTGY